MAKRVLKHLHVLVLVVLWVSIAAKSNTTDTDFGTDNKATEASYCNPGYQFNPYRPSCVRLVHSKVSWSAAKAACEAKGEYLVILESISIVNWFRTLRSNNADWRNAGDLWVGAKRYGNDWTWQGIRTMPMWVSDWESGEPNSPPSGDYCVRVYGWTRLTWDDFPCSGSFNYVCEARSKLK